MQSMPVSKRACRTVSSSRAEARHKSLECKTCHSVSPRAKLSAAAELWSDGVSLPQEPTEGGSYMHDRQYEFSALL